ncbi:MAG: butyryl-CoA:acetate CoA-transferase [Eubacteriales bacterium]|nr:butyryl-CoA:acetate CoA-transferase [Eubacteriales bacterium]
MSYQDQYRQKLVSAAQAAAVVKSGDWVDYSWTATTSRAVDKELAKRMPDLYDVNFYGGILMHEPEIFKIEDPAAHLTWNSWHMGGIERKACTKGYGFYNALKYSELPRWYLENIRSIDVAIMQVGPMDDKGFFNCGPSASHTYAVVQTAKKVIVEVNESMPICLGDRTAYVHIDDVDMIVETDNAPIDAMPPSKPGTEVDKAVAELVVKEIPDGACLQLGIGGMPNTIGKMIAESDLKDLGIHTEMYVDAFVDIAEAGKITGAHKNIDRGLQTFAFGAGTKKMYDYLDKNPEIKSASVDYVNHYYRVAALDNFISINNAVDMDLFGQINAESSGTKQISGAGGQLDFVLGAYGSNGGKTFICMSSTFKNKDGSLASRIRPTLAPGSIVTDTRPNVMYVVTEYGCRNLKGLSSWQRAEAIISLAHPDFRDELIQEAEKMHIWKRSNKR